MKSLLFLTVFYSLSATAEISQVSQGTLIQASKLNELITQLNELNSKVTLLEQKILPTGSIVNSLLSLNQFKAENGDCWRAMDGQALNPTDDLRSLYGYTSIPNASGRFLRNSGGDAAPLAQAQEDAMQPITGYAGLIMYGNSADGSFYGSGTLTQLPGGTPAPAQSLYINTARQTRTASETRPKNLTVNMFIKFKKACNFN